MDKVTFKHFYQRMKITDDEKEHWLTMFKNVNDYIDLEKNAGRCDTEEDIQEFIEGYHMMMNQLELNVTNGYLVQSDSDSEYGSGDFYVYHLTEKGIEYMNITKL